MYYSKRAAGLLSIILLLLIIFPIRENFRAVPQDNFPLSYYPMFSYKRAATYSMNYVVGYDQAGQQHLVPYRLLGTGGFNQVRRQLNKRCRKGRAQKIADEAAKRIGQQTQPPFSTLTRLEVVSGKFYIEDFLVKNQRSPKQSKVLASANISR